jgi:hypothetical protein
MKSPNYINGSFLLQDTGLVENAAAAVDDSF